MTAMKLAKIVRKLFENLSKVFRTYFLMNFINKTVFECVLTFSHFSENFPKTLWQFLTDKSFLPVFERTDISQSVFLVF